VAVRPVRPIPDDDAVVGQSLNIQSRQAKDGNARPGGLALAFNLFEVAGGASLVK